MFEGTLTYNVGRDFKGEFFHRNFRKIVCFIKDGYYKEEFWTDKTNKYFIRIFNFNENIIYQINIRNRIIQKQIIPNESIIQIINPNIDEKNNTTSYELIYNDDFGLKSTIKYMYISDTNISIKLDQAKHIRICSKLPKNNKEIASFFKENPKSRYRSSKDYKLVGVQHKQLDIDEFNLDKFANFKVINEKLNRYIDNHYWGKKIWKEDFNKLLLSFYEQVLNFNLSIEQKQNISAYHTLRSGLLEDKEYKEIQKKLSDFEKDFKSNR